MLSKDQKILFLREILERKDTLFGSFANISDDNRRKKDAWSEIIDVLRANGYKDVVTVT